MPYTTSEIAKTKERLEALRKEKKLSFEQLSKLLDEQGTPISHTNLRNYEISDSLHDLYGRTEGMSLKNIIAIADVYGVSLDYLLGRSDSKKREYFDISENLRLRDNVIDTLMGFRADEMTYIEDYGHRMTIINDLLSNEDIIEAISYIQIAVLDLKIYDDKNTPEMMADRESDPGYKKALKKLKEYGYTATNPKVISELHINKAVALIDQVLRAYPEQYKRIHDDEGPSAF
jgi:transcriptional regulator with XRE-family HTH domain